MDSMIESKELAEHPFKATAAMIDKSIATYGYYLIYGIKGTGQNFGSLFNVRPLFFKYLREAKAFVGQELTTDHQVVSLIRGKAVEFRIESRLTV